MNVKKFFELAKERGITASQLVINRSKCSSIETFNHGCFRPFRGPLWKREDRSNRSKNHTMAS